MFRPLHSPENNFHTRKSASFIVLVVDKSMCFEKHASIIARGVEASARFKSLLCTASLENISGKSMYICIQDQNLLNSQPRGIPGVKHVIGMCTLSRNIVHN